MSKNKNIKPIHKWNNGNLATLCHLCNCIVSLGHTEDLYCKDCRKEMPQDIMNEDEALCLYFEQMEKEVHQNRSNLNK
jgi:hypothetical protein